MATFLFCIGRTWQVMLGGEYLIQRTGVNSSRKMAERSVTSLTDFTTDGMLKRHFNIFVLSNQCRGLQSLVAKTSITT